MALTAQQRLANGETPQAVYGNQQQKQQQQQPQSNFLQSLLGGLKGFGLGAVQDIAAPTYLAGQEIMHGQNPIAGVGNNANINQLNEYAKSNPFATKQQLQQEGGTLPQAAMQVGKDTAGAASWMTPMSAEGWLARGALGAGQGVLNGVSQDGANPTSVATNAVTSAGLNMVNPLIAKGLQSAWGKLAFGQGGDKFGDIIRAVGQPITGGTKTLGNNLYNKTQPLRDTFDTLLADAQGGIPKSKIFGKTTVSGQIDPEDPGILGTIINDVGISARGKAYDYAKQLQQHLDDLHTQYLTNQGLSGEQALPIVQNHDLPTPLPVVQNFLHDLGGDTKVFDSGSPVGNMAKQLYGEVKSRVANASGNPDLYNNLQGLKQAGKQISNSVTNGDQSNPLTRMLGTRLTRILVNGGLLGGTGIATLAHPALAIPGLALEAGIQPSVASAGISFANSPLGKLLGTMGRRTASSTAGNVMTTPQ